MGKSSEIPLVAWVGWEALAGQGLGPPAGQEASFLAQGKPRARQRWTESPGRDQESQFHILAFFSEICEKMLKMLILGCGALGWDSWACLRVRIGQERSALGRGKPRTWHLAPGTWPLAAGTWHLAPDTWHLALGTSHLAPGTWHLSPGTWHLAPGT